MSNPTTRLSYLKKAEAVGEREIKAVLAKGRDKLELTILKSVKKKNFVSAAFVRDNLYKEIGKQYGVLNEKVMDWQMGMAKHISRQWRQFAIEDLPKGSYSQTWNQFSKKYVDEIFGRVSGANATKMSAVNARLGGMMSEDIRYLRNSVLETRRLGALTGMNGPQMQRNMRDAVLKERPNWQFIDSAGKKWKTNNYFKLLNNTISANVARSSYSDTAVEAGHDLVRIESHGANSCESCQRWSGRILSLTGNTEGYPPPDEAIGDGWGHPNCMCYYSVVLPEFKAE